jgi:hypothetical protein
VVGGPWLSRFACVAALRDLDELLRASISALARTYPRVTYRV